MRYRRRSLIALACWAGVAAACAPGTKARVRANSDPVSYVRVLPSARALADVPHRVLDTLETRLRPDVRALGVGIDARIAAAEKGANAIAVLDTIGSGKGARVRTLVVRVEDSWADVMAHCLSGSDGVAEGEQLRACERVVARDSTNPAAWRRLAALRHGQWDYKGERVALERYLAMRPDDAEAWFAFGRAIRGNAQARHAAWRRAAALDSTYQEPRLALGTELGTRRETAAQALPWLDEAARLGERGEVLYQRGRALLVLEQWDVAYAAFMAAADAGGRLKWCLGGAAYAQSRAGRHAEAVALWDRVLGMESGYFNLMLREFGMIEDEKAAWKRSMRAVGRR